jgi:hypothetical protein
LRRRAPERLDDRARCAPQPLGQLPRAGVGALESALEQIDERAVLVAVADRVEAQYRGLFLCVTVGEAHVEPLRPYRRASAHDDPGCRLSIAGRHGIVDAVPRVVKPDEVRVRVEDDDAKRRLEQELLEDRAEGVRLPRPRLAAEERVPVEPAGV